MAVSPKSLAGGYNQITMAEESRQRSSFPAVTAENTFHVLDPVGDFQIGMVIRFSGRIQHALLEKSCRLSLDLVPVLGARFVPGWCTGTWQPINKQQFVLEQKIGIDPDDRKVLAFFETPIDYLAGPQVKAVLYQGETDTLCLNVSHFAADAAGVKAYATLLADIYTKLSANPGYRPPALTYTSRSLRQITEQFTLRQKLGIAGQVWKDIMAQPPVPRPYTLPGRKAPNQRRVYIIHHINPDRYHHTLTWCRAHGATLNDVLMAAFFRAFHHVSEATGEKRFQNRAHRLIVTADLRRYLPPDQAVNRICSLSGWVPVRLDQHPARTIDDSSLAVSRMMTKKKQGYLGLGVLSAGAVGMKLSPLCVSTTTGKVLAALAAAAGTVAPSFTNMGRVDPALLDFAGIGLEEAFLVPPVVYPPVFGCGVSGFKDTLTLSAGICEPGFQRQTVVDLFEAVDRELGELSTPKKEYPAAYKTVFNQSLTIAAVSSGRSSGKRCVASST